MCDGILNMNQFDKKTPLLAFYGGGGGTGTIE